VAKNLSDPLAQVGAGLRQTGSVLERVKQTISDARRLPTFTTVNPDWRTPKTLPRLDPPVALYEGE
jgi:hypothetical protein